MSENKRFTVPLKYSLSHSKIQCDGEPLTNDELVRILNTNDGAFLENFNLKEEKKELQCQCNLLREQANEFHRIALENGNRVGQLEKENEQLKETINEVKTDEKQLSISFMDYKMQLIEVLQQNYNYAYSQRQKNLDKSIVAKTYEVLAQTVCHIAETMNVDIERFPRDGDVE